MPFRPAFAIVSMPRHIALVGFLTLAAACSSAPVQKSDSAASATPKESAEDLTVKRADLERQIQVAKMRLDKAQMDQSHQKMSSQDAMHRAEEDVKLARSVLTQFDSQDSKMRLEKSRLSLKRMEDSLDETKEELAQLEMMYKEQDLADKTREIVLRRGKRRVERSEAALALEKQEMVELEKYTLPLEHRKLELDLDAKTRALEAAGRSVKEGSAEREIGLTSARMEVEKLQTELDKLGKAKKVAGDGPGGAPAEAGMTKAR